MSSRFNRGLFPVLDTSELVGDAAAAATEVDAPAPAPQSKEPSWRLNNIATLKNAGNANPIVMHASGMLLSTKDGERLHRDLEKIVRKKVRIVVETFETPQALNDRLNQLVGGEYAPESDQPTNGFTDPFRGPGDFLFALDKGTNKPTGFNVLLLIPRAHPSDLPIRTEVDCIMGSKPFRLLRISATMFHELLHVHRIYTLVDFENEIARSSTRNNGFFDDIAPTDPTLLGHGDDASSTIDPITLKLTTGGEFDPAFANRIASFVDQVVVKYRLRDAIAKECAAFKGTRDLR